MNWRLTLIALVVLGGCERRPTTTPPTTADQAAVKPADPAPAVDPKQALLDGDIDAAHAAYTEANNPIGLAEIAAIRGDHDALRKILARFPAAGTDRLDAATQLIPHLSTIPEDLLPLAEQACAISPKSRLCARLEIGADRELRKCVAGCDGEHVIGFHLANFPIVFATVGGVRGAFMLTSAGPSLLTPEFAARVLDGAEPAAQIEIGSSGTTVDAEVVVADLEVEGIKLKDVDFTVLELPESFIVGALSPDELFAGRRVTFDLAKYELRVGPSSPVDNGAPMVRVEEGPVMWGRIDNRPPRPFMIDLGNRHLNIGATYDQLDTPLPVAQQTTSQCAGGVECTVSVVSPFEAQMEMAGVPLYASFAFIKPHLGEPTAPLVLAPQALIGTGALLGRVVTLDLGSNSGSITGGDTSLYEVGDEADFIVTGSAVRGAPVTWSERVHDVGTSMDIDIVMEGTDRSETWKMRVENSPDIGHRFLLSSKPEAVWERTPDGPVQRELADFAAAMSNINVSAPFASGEAIAPEPLLAKQGDVIRRCLRVQHHVQLSDDLGLMTTMHCSGDPWAIAHVRVEDDEGEALMDYRRIGLSEPYDPLAASD